MGFQIQNTKLRIDFSITQQKDGTEVHHKERQICYVGNSLLFDIHEIIQAPIMLGIPDSEGGIRFEIVRYSNHRVFHGTDSNPC